MIPLWNESESERDAVAALMRDYYRTNSEYHPTIGELSGERPSEEERAFFDAVAAAAARIPAPHRVLELGSGRAESVRYLLQRLPGEAKYIGIDASPEAVAVAAAEHPAYDMSVGDIAKLDLPDSSVDICFFNYVLEHTSFPDRVLSEALRVVRPGGLVGMIVPTLDLPWLIPSSERHRRSEPLHVARRALQRAIDMLLVRYSADYYAFRLVRRPLAVERATPFAPDDDLVYCATSFELEKWLRANRTRIEWVGRRDITPCIANGRRPTIDIARRVVFAALRAALEQRNPTTFTTTVSLVARKLA